jgi:tetratricopeptide (TPR) repeat protein
MNFLLKKCDHFIIFGIFLGLLSCSSRKDDLNSKQAMLYYGAGTQSLMTKNYTDALTNLLHADKLMPGNADIIINLGMAYYFKGETNLAVKELKRALEINKNNSDAKLNLASIYYQMGDIQGAESLYHDVLRDLTYDKQARTYYNLGVLEVEKRKNLSRGEKYFKLALKEDENYCPAFYQLGTIQIRRGMTSTAEKTFRQGTRGVCVEYPANYYQHALALIELRRFQDARLRLDEIDVKFKDSPFAKLAGEKMRELSTIESSTKSSGVQVRNQVLETPDF